MSKIFVIAGNRAEADQWIKGNLEKRKNSGVTTLSWSDYVVVKDPVTLRGYRNPSGVFIGTWRQRKDMEGIFQLLLMATDITSNRHRMINQLWGEWQEANPKPTPKLKPVAGGWVNQNAFVEQNKLVDSTISNEQLTSVMIKAIKELNDKVKELENAKNTTSSTGSSL